LIATFVYNKASDNMLKNFSITSNYKCVFIYLEKFLIFENSTHLHYPVCTTDYRLQQEEAKTVECGPGLIA